MFSVFSTHSVGCFEHYIVFYVSLNSTLNNDTMLKTLLIKKTHFIQNKLIKTELATLKLQTKNSLNGHVYNTRNKMMDRQDNVSKTCVSKRKKLFNLPNYKQFYTTRNHTVIISYIYIQYIIIV